MNQPTLLEKVLAARRHLTNALVLVQSAEMQRRKPIETSLANAQRHIRDAMINLRYASDSVAAAAEPDPEEAA